MHGTTVTVVIPVYNRVRSILRAIDSVLAQTFKDYELIIVDDASTDDLATALASVTDSRMRLVSHKHNKGAAAARNTGISQAQGRYVAFLDSDDRWLPEKLQRQLDSMTGNGLPVKASCTGYRVFTRYHPEGELRTGKPVMQQSDFLLGCRVSPGSTLVAEKSVFDEVGVFDESMRRLEDWDWLLRYTQKHDLQIFPEIMSEVYYTSNIGPDFEHVAQSIDTIKKRYCKKGVFPYSSRNRILGTLENEIAASAYKNERYGVALSHFLMSLWYHPHRSKDTIQRLFGAVWRDFFTSSK